MFETPRLLITTEDESTWRFDRPVIFLGEWCRSYDRRHIWQNMDAIVAEPYGLGKAKIDADIAKAKRIEDEIFPLLCRSLNGFHEINKSERFWRIIIGHWFHDFVQVMLNRTNSLQKCLVENNIAGISSPRAGGGNLTISQFDSYWHLALEDPTWNGEVYLRILEILSSSIPVIENAPVGAQVNINDDYFKGSYPKGIKLRKALFHFLKKISPLLSRKTDAFIVSSYMHPKEEIKLQIGLGQFPSFWKTPEVKIKTRPNLQLRKQLTNELLNNLDEGLLKIVKTLLFEVFPLAYLEGFSEIEFLASRQPWPNKPKFIFTSNAFFSNDVYKFWFANKVESGVKYFVGQHGNNYFTDRRLLNSVEEITADKFLTWGCTDESGKYIPAFVFQNHRRTR